MTSNGNIAINRLMITAWWILQHRTAQHAVLCQSRRSIAILAVAASNFSLRDTISLVPHDGRLRSAIDD